ncbi:class II fructose-bisphosphate aldolase [Rhodohalobacter sp. 614A]|uniref:class II fructose-bisphosphate aldolase n=1 Tax=Rhodohalobacter sp. 614A TaxID=2908649 RepID=UPI001F2C3031|nr:class II fructose-bisphosphate aldolase [Rhodohalobacter sp. 614A]
MTLQEKFNELEQKNSALLATNFYNFETVTGILQAVKTLGMPIILQASPSTIDYLGVNMTVALARSSLEKHEVEGWLHLDHAHSFSLIQQCLDAGFDSVMIDASEKSFEENVEITSKVTELAKNYGANVEAELGYVAKLGQAQQKEDGFTKPEEAKKFEEQTGINALAVAIGSAHGFYTSEPKLDLDRLQEIDNVTECALVLHGGSGIPKNQVQEGIRRGIRKINVATEIKDIFMSTLQADLRDNDEIDLRKVFPPAIHKVDELVQSKLMIIKSLHN